jgi:hypothetical protein
MMTMDQNEPLHKNKFSMFCLLKWNTFSCMSFLEDMKRNAHRKYHHNYFYGSILSDQIEDLCSQCDNEHISEGQMVVGMMTWRTLFAALIFASSNALEKTVPDHDSHDCHMQMTCEGERNGKINVIDSPI